MTEKNYARTTEQWVTIKEIISANPDPKDGVYTSTNGIIVNKPIFLAYPENTSIGEKSSTSVFTDGGNDVIHITAFGEFASMVDNLKNYVWYFISGYLRYDSRIKNRFYVTPTNIVPVDEVTKNDVLRFWYLSIILNRIRSEKNIPKNPCQNVLTEEKFPFEVVDDMPDWLKVETIEPQQPRRVIERSKEVEDNGWGVNRTKVLSFLKENKTVTFKDYFEWTSTKCNLTASQAEGLMIDLSNDGLIDQGDDEISLKA